MATTIDEAAIPATVTVNGEELFEALVLLMRTEERILAFNGGQDTIINEHLTNAFCAIWHAAFGQMTRDCDYGRPDGCWGDARPYCLACNGTELESATPLYRRALEAARAAA